MTPEYVRRMAALTMPTGQEQPVAAAGKASSGMTVASLVARLQTMQADIDRLTGQTSGIPPGGTSAAGGDAPAPVANG